MLIHYIYVDCWQSSRTTEGVIVADPNAFPSGIKPLAEYGMYVTYEEVGEEEERRIREEGEGG